jgi:riboflavin synthase
LSEETLDVTTLGLLAVGARVNLERALKVGDRLGGHLVSGHVDGVAVVRQRALAGDAHRVELATRPDLLTYLAPKGSVSLDGVSLTVNGVTKDGFDVMLIPHTLSVTTLAELQVDSRLNLEVDLVARYVTRWLSSNSGAVPRPSVAPESVGLAAALKRSGLM